MYRNKTRHQIYFNNEDTSFQYQTSKQVTFQYLDREAGNAKQTKTKSEALKQLTVKLILNNADNLKNYACCLTSGATEANCIMLKSLCGPRDHVIISKDEHWSVVNAAKQLKLGGVQISLVGDGDKQVTWNDIKKEIRENTKLVCVVAANCRTGIKNDLSGIGTNLYKANKKRNNAIFFHSDIAQCFSKDPIMIDSCRLDSVAISYHKIHGPVSIGALVIADSVKDKVLVGTPIPGDASNPYRGGNINLALIAGALDAVKITSINIEAKRARVATLKKYIVDQLKKNKIKIIYNNIKQVPDHSIVLFDRTGLQDSAAFLFCFKAKISPKRLQKVMADQDIFIGVAEDSVKLNLSFLTLRFELDRFVQCLVKALTKN